MEMCEHHMVSCQEMTKSDSEAEYRNHLGKSNECCFSEWSRRKASLDTQLTNEEFPEHNKVWL